MATTTGINDKTRISELTVSDLKELIREVIDEVIEERIKRPNKITRETFEKTDRGEDLIVCEDLADLFNKLEI
jgi:hypothetical protein